MTISESEQIQCVLPWDAYLGECPIWDQTEQCLYWVDILGKKIFRFDPISKTNETFDLPEIVPSIALRAKGGLVLTLKKSFAFYDPQSRKLERLAAVESDFPDNRFNDGKCDPHGRFWAGTMDAVHWDAPAGHLFRLDADQSVRPMQSEVMCANGTGWSPDGRTMYFTESFRYAVFAYDFDVDSGSISNRRAFMTIDKSTGGFPDGLTVDSEGFVWCNILVLGQIHRYDPKGKLERIIQCPVPRATSCAFGGADLKTLYITSSYETLTPDELKKWPLSGSLFAIETEVRGLPSTPYNG